MPFRSEEAKRLKKYTNDWVATDGPEVGDAKTFTPSAFFSSITEFALKSYNVEDRNRTVRGTCVSVNRDHRFARYRYETVSGGEAFECFKF